MRAYSATYVLAVHTENAPYIHSNPNYAISGNDLNTQINSLCEKYASLEMQVATVKHLSSDNQLKQIVFDMQTEEIVRHLYSSLKEERELNESLECKLKSLVMSNNDLSEKWKNEMGTRKNMYIAGAIGSGLITVLGLTAAFLRPKKDS